MPPGARFLASYTIRPRLTDQPTPNECGVTNDLSGAHSDSLSRAVVGGRKSYGTTLATLPVHVRSSLGRRSCSVSACADRREREQQDYAS